MMDTEDNLTSPFLLQKSIGISFSLVRGRRDSDKERDDDPTLSPAKPPPSTNLSRTSSQFFPSSFPLDLRLCIFSSLRREEPVGVEEREEGTRGTKGGCSKERKIRASRGKESVN